MPSFQPKKLATSDAVRSTVGGFRHKPLGFRKRHCTSTMNWQEIEINGVMEDGGYLYHARDHRLRAVAKCDLRKLAGAQGFVAKALLKLVYMADMARMIRASPENQALYSAADTRFIRQNFYLLCASEGMATVL